MFGEAGGEPTRLFVFVSNTEQPHRCLTKNLGTRKRRVLSESVYVEKRTGGLIILLP